MIESLQKKAMRGRRDPNYQTKRCVKPTKSLTYRRRQSQFYRVEADLFRPACQLRETV